MGRLQFLAIALAVIGMDAACGDEPASSNPRIESLAKKRAELRTLQQKVSALERELGVAGKYYVRCVIGEIPIDKLRQFELEVPTSEGSTKKLNGAELFGGPDPQAKSGAAIREPLGRLQVDAKEFQRFLDALKAAKAVKILGESTLLVESGHAATMHAGGRFSIPLPKSDNEWRNFGITLEAKVVPIDRNAVRLKISAEHAERDFKNAVELNGEKIPGLCTSRVNTESRMELGNSLLIAMPTQKSVRFFAVTPSAAP